ncbi:MAG: ankyrin repeat domain-containing protein [Burkholderiales bacterium]|nr:ankyrin repeat domain-containing protein [Burkholderiales bacterium]
MAMTGFVAFSGTSLAGAYEDMLQAIHLGDEKTMIQLLQRGMDVDTVNPRGETLLMLAAREGKPNVGSSQKTENKAR